MKSIFSKLLADTEREDAGFSLSGLRASNPALAAQFLWKENRLPDPLPSRWLQWGCGPNAFENFLNVDFQPQAAGVIEWDFLDLWPAEGEGQFEGAFSEDTLEHFFLGEQSYILCNLNLLLQQGAVSRILMPSYARLAQDAVKEAQAGAFLHDTFGVATSVDAINMGMRFSGHRWLHDQQSLAFLAADCGFEALSTPCATSTVERFNGCNLRDESNSASFANDLIKRRGLKRVVVPPTRIDGAEKIEELEGGIAIWRATRDDPNVFYQLESSVASTSLALANIRSASVSEFRHHYYKFFQFRSAAAAGTYGDWRLDETVKSKPCMNIVTRQQARQALAALPQFDEVLFRPAGIKGHCFTLGDLELFIEHD